MWCRPQIRIVYLLHVSQTCEFESSKANRRLRFSLLSIILTVLRKLNFTSQVEKVMVCDL